MPKRQFDKKVTAELRIFAAVAMAFSMQHVHAAYNEGDRFWITPEINSWYDSNVFRIADSANTQIATGSHYRDDFIWQPKVTGHIETDISRQNLYIDGSVFSRNYQKHSALNYTGINNTVGWNWVVGSDWAGTIKYNNLRDLSSFEDISTAQRDMRVADIISGSVFYKLTSHWQFLVDANVDNEDHNVNNELDLRSVAIGEGIQYITDKGSSIVLRHDNNRITYLNDYNIWSASERGFQQSSNQVIFTWPVTSKLKTTLNLGNLKWHYDTDDSTHTGSFSGVSFDWAATEKIKLNASYNRQMNAPSQNLDSSMADAFSTGITWIASAKTRYVFTYRNTKQEYVGTNARTDNIQFYQISSNWMPIINWNVIAYIQEQSRDSDIKSNQYSANSIGLSLQYKF